MSQLKKKNDLTKKSSNKKSLAKERWDILKQAIINKDSAVCPSKASVRRFDSFGFVKCQVIDDDAVDQDRSSRSSSSSSSSSRSSNRSGNSDDDNNHRYKKKSSRKNRSSKATSVAAVASNKTNKTFEWQEISVPSLSDLSVKARFYKGPVSLDEMTGFDNTGNVCLWPSEEIMTYFCIKNGIIFKNKHVCELGGGMTCLAGLLISKICNPREVFLTDGNESSFENLEAICNENEFNCAVECCLLEWKKETSYGDLENRFDYILCADCLFFDDFRQDLCATIYKLLKPNGTCLIFAPNRKNTFHKFVDLAKINFECMIVHNYDDEIWQLHIDHKENNDDYEEDIHYPLLLKLCKRDSNSGFCKMVL